MPSYHLKNIRALLTQRFPDQELRRLCYDEPDFRPVYEKLAQTTGKAEIIDHLIEYAEQKRLLDALLILVEKYNQVPSTNPRTVSASNALEISREIDNLDVQILRILYGHFQQHPGDPRIGLKSFIKIIKVEQADLINWLFVLREKGWLEYSLTDKAETGLIWLTPDGIKIARDI